MLYHLGALARLNELGFLPRIAEIASVSGGSITAAVLARAWSRLEFGTNGVAANFETEVAAPIVCFAGVGVDVRAVLSGLVPWRTAADGVAEAYDRHLLHGITLQDLPDRPRFTFMATNLQTGSGWRFAKAYAADHRVGRILAPRFSLARVVAASSSFPPFLSPTRFNLSDHTVEPMPGADLHRPPFTHHAVLTDGGVYDNLALERVWKRCRTVLVSNAGKTIPDIGSPTSRWGGQVLRALAIVQQQGENARRRILFGVANLGQRRVAYWSIDTPIGAYKVAKDYGITDADSAAGTAIRTRLNPFTEGEITLLRRLGHAGADAALTARGFLDEQQPRAAE
jgi:NTE family protein